MNSDFKQFVDTLDYLEVMRVTITPKGEFKIPSEKDGKIAQVAPTTRHALAAFLREAADRLECPDAAHVKKSRTGMRRRADRAA
jgi:hypothetical protein